MFPRILPALVATAVSFAFAHVATAAGPVTATIDLTTDQGKPCTITTTDPLGLHLGQGGTNLTASPATLSGEGCGTGSTGPKNPPTTPFILTPNPNPLVATVGLPFTVSWTLTGGKTPITCAGSFSGAPASAALSGWVQSASANIGTNTRTITPTAADIGNGTVGVSFTLAMTCSNADGSITSSALPITINPTAPADNCPAGRVTKAPSVYAGSYGLCYQSPANLCTTDGGQDNLTTFPIWIGRFRGTENGVARITPAAPPYLDFPGASGSGPSFQIKAGQYVSARFTVPLNLPVGKKGTFTKSAGNIQGSGWVQTNADMSISTACGDFDSASIPSTCKVTNAANDAPAIRWILGEDEAFKCRLEPGQTYYLNVRPNGCTATWCTIRIDD